MMSETIKVASLGFPWQTQDPFIFCAYHKDHYPAGRKDMSPAASLQGRRLGQDFDPSLPWRMYHGRSIPGFPQHPHRGFETITIAKQGVVDHADSLGAAGRFGGGDVQWMTAGKGVLHSEMFPLLHEDRDNPLEIFQIWLNLPGAHKMVEPHFKMLWSDTIPQQIVEDEHGRSTYIDAIAGELSGAIPPTPPPASWANDPANHVAVWSIEMSPEASWKLPGGELGVVRNLFFYDGRELWIDGQHIPVHHRITANLLDPVVIKNGQETSSLLLLQGMPINEPVAQHGPFVMNTQQEIETAFHDYRRTQFGGWPWPKDDQVHAKESGRFALHGNGHREDRESFS